MSSPWATYDPAVADPVVDKWARRLYPKARAEGVGVGFADLEQAGRIGAMNAFARRDDGGDFDAFLDIAVRHAMDDEIRANRWGSRYYRDQDRAAGREPAKMVFVPEYFSVRDPAADDPARAAELKDFAERAMKILRGRHRRLIRLLYLDELSYPEIARKLRCSMAMMFKIKSASEQILRHRLAA